MSISAPGRVPRSHADAPLGQRHQRLARRRGPARTGAPRLLAAHDPQELSRLADSADRSRSDGDLRLRGRPGQGRRRSVSAPCVHRQLRRRPVALRRAAGRPGGELARDRASPVGPRERRPAIDLRLVDGAHPARLRGGQPLLERERRDDAARNRHGAGRVVSRRHEPADAMGHAARGRRAPAVAARGRRRVVLRAGRRSAGAAAFPLQRRPSGRLPAGTGAPPRGAARRARHPGRSMDEHGRDESLALGPDRAAAAGRRARRRRLRRPPAITGRVGTGRPARSAAPQRAGPARGPGNRPADRIVALARHGLQS